MKLTSVPPVWWLSIRQHVQNRYSVLRNLAICRLQTEPCHFFIDICFLNFENGELDWISGRKKTLIYSVLDNRLQPTQKRSFLIWRGWAADIGTRSAKTEEPRCRTGAGSESLKLFALWVCFSPGCRTLNHHWEHFALLLRFTLRS